MTKHTFTPKLGAGFSVISTVDQNRPPQPARIIALDRKPQSPGEDAKIVALVEVTNGGEIIRVFMADGSSANDSTRLIDTPPEPVVCVTWHNIFPDRIGSAWPSKAGADRRVGDNRIGLIKMTCIDGKPTTVELVED